MNYIDIVTVPLSYDDILQKLRDQEPFDFSRYGDGEMECMWNKRGRPRNSDLHDYFKDLGEELKRVLQESPTYYLGLQHLGYRQNREIIEQWTSQYNLQWSQADVFHKASMRGRIQELIDVLNDREVLLIGNHYLSKLGWKQLEIPLQNAWNVYDDIKNYIQENITPDMVVVYCCGMMASVLVHEFQGQCTQIDTGSCFDPYCGYMSRGYHFELPVPKGVSSTYFKQRGK